MKVICVSWFSLADNCSSPCFHSFPVSRPSSMNHFWQPTVPQQKKAVRNIFVRSITLPRPVCWANYFICQQTRVNAKWVCQEAWYCSSYNWWSPVILAIAKKHCKNHLTHQLLKVISKYLKSKTISLILSLFIVKSYFKTPINFIFLCKKYFGFNIWLINLGVHHHLRY